MTAPTPDEEPRGSIGDQLAPCVWLGGCTWLGPVRDRRYGLCPEHARQQDWDRAQGKLTKGGSTGDPKPHTLDDCRAAVARADGGGIRHVVVNVQLDERQLQRMVRDYIIERRALLLNLPYSEHGDGGGDERS